ncbi:MAG TPA: hypothetical protein DEG76_03485 [Pseudohongiella sp.]|nr:hypothetical protein [Pseudohongiella sp.]
MILINDMLRDLDARRRDAPGGRTGPEKLVPASPGTSHRPANSSSPKVWLLVAFLLLVAAATAFWFLRGSGVEQQTFTTQPLATATSQAPADMAPQTSADDGENEMIRELERRLQDLERQNQALLSQQSSSAQSEANSVSSGSPSSSEVSSNAATRNQQAAQWQPRDWESASEGQSANAGQARQSMPDASTGSDSAVAAILAGSNAGNAEAENRLEQQPQNGQSAGIVREQRPMSLTDRDRREVQLALEQWADGQRIAALQTLDSFIYQEPEAHLSREMLAKLLIQQGEQERALQAVELGLRIQPNRAAYKKIKARLLIDQGQAPQAAEVLMERPPAMTSDIEYHDMLATALLASQNYADAASTYQALLRQNNSIGRWWYGLAVALDTVGRRVEAAEAYQQAARREDLPPALREQSRERLALIRAAQ